MHSDPLPILRHALFQGMRFSNVRGSRFELSRLSRSQVEDYLENRSEAAFCELVSRYLDLVYSSAVRLVNSAHLAEDIAPK